jgi:hypothetical protein
MPHAGIGSVPPPEVREALATTGTPGTPGQGCEQAASCGVKQRCHCPSLVNGIRLEVRCALPISSTGSARSHSPDAGCAARPSSPSQGPQAILEGSVRGAPGRAGGDHRCRGPPPHDCRRDRKACSARSARRGCVGAIQHPAGQHTVRPAARRRPHRARRAHRAERQVDRVRLGRGWTAGGLSAHRHLRVTTDGRLGRRRRPARVAARRRRAVLRQS